MAPQTSATICRGMDPRTALLDALTSHRCDEALWSLTNSGWMAEHIPEIAALDMEQQPGRPQHKNVLAHTYTVVSQCPARPRVRLGALFHDIGKPDTRAYSDGAVTFANHEAVGGRIARKRLAALGFDMAACDDIGRMVEMSGRLKGYGEPEWSDSAVRRYAREAGELLGDLNDMIRADCTSKHRHKHEQVRAIVDDIERRISELASADARAAERSEVDGRRVMEYLGIGPGPQVGAALRFLLELRRDHGELGEAECLRRLDGWRQHACRDSNPGPAD